MKLRPTVLAAALAALALALEAPSARAATAGEEPPALEWSFAGAFGTYDRGELQRGFQVYREVCAGCHSLDLIAFRNLADLGFDELEVKAFAAEYEVPGAPDEYGDPTMRPAIPADRFPAPFPNDAAARASNNGALPPDLSLMVEARAGGADYLHALLTGYGDPPDGVEVAEGMNYNRYFPGGQIAMAPPLFEGAVEYADGTEATEAQHARDVTAFLAWASEPNMEERKRTGVMAILFLVVLAGLLYAGKRKVWSDVH